MVTTELFADIIVGRADTREKVAEMQVGPSGLTIGRHPDNKLQLNDSKLSRHHMVLSWEGDILVARDFASANGVWVNNVRIAPMDPKPLSAGDTISIGNHTILIKKITGGVARPSKKHTQTNVIRGVEEIGQRQPLPPHVAGYMPHRREREYTEPPRVQQGLQHFPEGLPQHRSNWLKYLPSIYSDENLDPHHFIARYLCIFEDVFNPVLWAVDNFDLYLSPQTAPQPWLVWISSWFDVELLNEPYLPEHRQRDVVSELSWLFSRRGTPAALSRFLTLYLDTVPTIEENPEQAHFVVYMTLDEALPLAHEIARRLIESQKPAHTTYELHIESPA